MLDVSYCQSSAVEIVAEIDELEEKLLNSRVSNASCQADQYFKITHKLSANVQEGVSNLIDAATTLNRLKKVVSEKNLVSQQGSRELNTRKIEARKLLTAIENHETMAADLKTRIDGFTNEYTSKSTLISNDEDLVRNRVSMLEKAVAKYTQALDMRVSHDESSGFTTFEFGVNSGSKPAAAVSIRADERDGTYCLREDCARSPRLAFFLTKLNETGDLTMFLCASRKALLDM